MNDIASFGGREYSAPPTEIESGLQKTAAPTGCAALDPIGAGPKRRDTPTTKASPDPIANGQGAHDARIIRAVGDPIGQGHALDATHSGAVQIDPIADGQPGVDTLEVHAVGDPISRGPTGCDTLHEGAAGDLIARDHSTAVTLRCHVPADPIDGEGSEASEAHGQLALAVDPARLREVELAVDAVRDLYRRAAFMTKNRIMMSNRTAAYVRLYHCGWRLDLPEKERDKITKEAARVVKEARAGRGDPTLVLFVQCSDEGSAAYARYEAEAEKALAKAVRKLPGYQFVKGVRGFGDLSFGRIVGEAGPLHIFDNPAKLWKRMGLAVVGGERQRKHTNAELALLHGYSPRRRSVSWVAFDSLLKGQLRRPKGDDDDLVEDAVTEAIGPYGEHYLRKRAEYAERAIAEEWPEKGRKMRCHRMAARYAEKKLLKHLWRAWRQEMASC